MFGTLLAFLSFGTHIANEVNVGIIIDIVNIDVQIE